MKIALIFVAVLFALVLAGAILLISQFSLSALPEPGRFETYLAARAKRFLIHKSSSENIPPPPADRKKSIEVGEKLFGTECAACHGLNGHKPTDAGRWMYPRSADLTSSEVQEYSDRELFWIVKNGIRLSGMPAFGEVETDEHIWNLVQYLETLDGGKRE
jgi:mono/diheme cytochrome c family protein